MKILTTKYNYETVQALDLIEFVDSGDEIYPKIKELVFNTPDGFYQISMDESLVEFTDSEQEKFITEFLKNNPDNISAKNDLLFLDYDKYPTELFLKLFSREKDHIETGAPYDGFIMLNDLRMIIYHLSDYYTAIEDNENQRKLLKWTLERGFKDFAEIIICDIYDLEDNNSSRMSMMHYQEVRDWTHNLLVSDHFKKLQEIPYNLDFLGLINWNGIHFDHDLYLRILDSNDENLLHDIKWLFYQNLNAYQNSDKTKEVTGILVLINFINHFEITELVSLATTSILTMPEDLYRSMAGDLDSLILNDLLIGMLRLNGDDVVEVLLNDDVIDEIDDPFRWFILIPFFKCVASLSKQDNEEGNRFKEYFRQLVTYYEKYEESKQWLIDQGESYNYSEFKEIVDSAYASGEMNSSIFGAEPIGISEEPLPLEYDKKAYFENLDNELDTSFTFAFAEMKLETIEAKMKSEIELEIKKSADENGDDHFDVLNFIDVLSNGYDEFPSYNDQREADVIPITYKRDNPKVGRNEPCLCGSGKKYKKCCLNK